MGNTLVCRIRCEYDVTVHRGRHKVGVIYVNGYTVGGVFDGE